MVGRGPRSGVARVGRGGESGVTFFLLQEPALPGSTVLLSPDEAHHALRVRRLGKGALVPATDGCGGRYRLRLEPQRGSCAALVLERTEEPRARPSIEIGLGAGRRERFLWCVEKLTELEISRVTPLLSAAVQERKALAGEAGRRLAVRSRARAAAALKQSMGTYLPEIGEVEGLMEWAARPFAGASILLALPAPGISPLPSASPAGPNIPPLAHAVMSALRAGAGALADAMAFRLAVGPEGGFLAEEEGLLAEAGFAPAHLGVRRLRFETAAIAAACQVRAVRALVECGS